MIAVSTADEPQRLLPGGLCRLDIAPEPKWPLALRNTRALHGVLSVLFNKPHGTTSLTGAPHSRLPAWSLRPCHESPCGWAVYWSDPDALPLSGRAHDVGIFNERRALYVSDAQRVAAPPFEDRKQRLVVTTKTPVVIQSADRTVRRQYPEASHIASTLRLHLAPRLGLHLAPEQMSVNLVLSNTAPVEVDCGGAMGSVLGWRGNLLVDCDAMAAWLLRCAATMGLGGRVAFGFGCVAVEEAPR